MSKVVSHEPLTESVESTGPPSAPELHDALGRLGAALREDAAAPGCGTASVTAAAWPVPPAFRRHVDATEGDGLLFADVEERAPWLSSDVGALRREHVGLQARLDHLMGPLEDPAGAGCADADALRRLREEGPGFIADVDAHRRREARLMFDAYVAGIGGD